jgi:mRNA interferase RelE/StbE
MKWKIRFDRKAERDLDRLDPQIAKRILRFLKQRVASLDDPRSIGEALRGIELGDLWKYRVGDYRIIADIQDQLIRIMIVRVGNRREVYR